MFDAIAYWLGYALMIVGGIALTAYVIYGLILAVLNIPIFKPKVIRILRKGIRADE